LSDKKRSVRLAVSSLNFSDFSGNSHLAPKKYTREEMFQVAKTMRVSGMEVSKLRTLKNPDELRSLGKKYGVPILGCSEGITAYGGSRNVDEFREVCRLTKELGGTYVSNLVDDSFSTGAGIAEVLSRKSAAEDAGMRYFLETHRLSITEDPDNARMIADAIPDLSFNADISHWIVQGYTPGEVSWVFPRVGHVHARVASTDNVQVEVADGKSTEVNEYFEHYLLPILDGGFHGTVVVEVIPHLLSNQRYYPVDDTFNLLRELRARLHLPPEG
jgi:sugar phosphate isomerase/epimerase